MQTPFFLNSSNPLTEGITENYSVARIILPAYAGDHSELQSVLQCVYHGFYYLSNGANELAELADRIFAAEIRHLDLLGEILLKLGVDPVFAMRRDYRTEYFSTETICYSKTPQKMLLDDIACKMLMVKRYKAMTERLTDGKTRGAVESILKDEQEHLAALESAFDKIRVK